MGFSPTTTYTPTTGSGAATPFNNNASSATNVATREAAHIPKAQATSPVLMDNLGGAPVTVQAAWDSFNTMSTSQRKAIQKQMFDGGLLTKQSDVSGNVNTISLAKWKSIVEESATSGNSIQAHLDILGTSQAYSQISADLQKQATSLQTAISAPKSINISLTNDAVLRDYAEKAWTAAQGHSPTEQELQTFVTDWHQSETAAGATQLSQSRQYDQGQLARTQGETTDLNNLGANGLDTFVNAYKTVMGNPTDTTVPTGAPTGPLPGIAGQAMSAFPPAPTTTGGGLFKLTPQAWAAGAKAANVDLKKYPTPTSAPESIQSTVFNKYADDQYQKLGNWADVASVIAGGKVGDAFGKRVATEVNGVVKTLVGNINAPGPDNVVASASADTSGIAAQQSAIDQAKSSDPVGYWAHQTSLYEGLATHLLGGGGALAQQSITPATIGMPPTPAGPVQPATVGAAA